MTSCVKFSCKKYNKELKYGDCSDNVEQMGLVKECYFWKATNYFSYKVSMRRTGH